MVLHPLPTHAPGWAADSTADTKKDKEEAFKADCQTWLAKIAGNNEALKLEKQEEEKVEKEKKEEKEEGK